MQIALCFLPAFNRAVCSSKALTSALCKSFTNGLITQIQRQPLSDDLFSGAPASTRESSGTESETPPSTTPPENPDLVEKALGVDLMSASERLKLELREIQTDFQRDEYDTGSPEVQAALLTKKISHVTEHLKVHRKDVPSQRGLLGMLSKRRKMLQYLRRSDFDAYSVVLVRLGLKDNFAKKDRFTILAQTPNVKQKAKRR